MLCALLVSAFAAQSASAITGTTAFTCVKTTADPNQFADPHCKEEVPTGGEYKHSVVPQDTTTSIRGNDSGPGAEAVSKLKSTVGGLAVTLTAEELEGGPNSWMTNAVDPNGEHYTHGEGTIKYTGVTVSVAKCFVYKDEGGVKGEKEKVDTEPLKATTTGQGMGLKFEPKEGTVFARFWILDAAKKTSAEGGECNIGATYEVTGSVIGTPEGATVSFTHSGTTTQNTLKMGAKAGIEGKLTIEGEDTEDQTDTWRPLSTTTVTTN